MKKLRTFWTSLTASASEPEYYEHVLRSKFSFSVKFFLLAQVLVTFATLAVFAVRRMPTLTTETQNQVKEVVQTLPDTFRASYASGQLHFSGVKLPYTIKTPTDLSDAGFPTTLATLSDKETSTTAPLLFLPKEIVVGNNQKNTLSYSDVWDNQSWSLDHDGIRQAAAAFVRDAANHSFPAFLIFAPVVYLFLTLNAVVLVLFFSVMTQLIAWILRLRLPYKKAVQMGLHAIVVSLLIDQVRLALWPTSPFEITGPAFFGIMLLALISLKRRYTLTLK